MNTHFVQVHIIAMLRLVASRLRGQAVRAQGMLSFYVYHFITLVCGLFVVVYFFVMSRRESTSASRECFSTLAGTKETCQKMSNNTNS